MDSLGGLLEVHALPLLGLNVLQHRLDQDYIDDLDKIICYLVHAAGELLVVIIYFRLGFVPDDGSPHVQHGGYNYRTIDSQLLEKCGENSSCCLGDLSRTKAAR